MGKAAETKVEVDMVPLIDIISLLLMFLVMVGDMSKNASSVHMKLPRASEAKGDKDLGPKGLEGRIVVQLKEEPKDSRKYKVIIDNNQYELAGANNGTLLKYFGDQITKRQANGSVTVDPKTGGVDIPIKLRVPANAPMAQVQQLMTMIAKAKLTNVQYAINNKDK